MLVRNTLNFPSRSFDIFQYDALEVSQYKFEPQHADHEDVTGRSIWDASLLLCAYIECLLQDRNRVPSVGDLSWLHAVMEVCDLGCGCGAVGCFLAAHGHNVCFYDRDEKALSCVSKSLQTNAFLGNLEVSKFDWTDSDNAHRTFDMIVIGDIIYDGSADADGRWSALINTIKSISHSGTMLFVCYVIRNPLLMLEGSAKCPFFADMEELWDYKKVEMPHEILDFWPLPREESHVKGRMSYKGEWRVYTDDCDELCIYSFTRR